MDPYIVIKKLNKTSKERCLTPSLWYGNKPWDLTQTLQQWKDAILFVYIRKLTGDQI